MNQNSKTKITFFGTPQFAVSFLRVLIDNPNFEVVAVVTQPDKPSGRQQTITPPPVKVLAQKYNLEILQPEKLKNNEEIKNRLKELRPDLSVIVAYGQIIPKDILEIFPLGNINVHPSLLPKYRGASPIQSAILNQEKTTGLTIMLMDEKMDHGPILAQKEITLNGDETNQSLHEFLAGSIGTDFLMATIEKFTNQEIKPQTQDDAAATYCQPILKEEAKINWQDSAQKISAKIRAFYPWPVAWTMLDGKRVKIFSPITIKKIKNQISPRICESATNLQIVRHCECNEVKRSNPTENMTGQIILEDDKMAVICGNGILEISKIQLEGKKEMAAADFIRGNHDVINKTFSS